MARLDARISIDPVILERLGAGKSGLWTAAHGDGSDNRINVDEVLEAGTYSTSLGVLDGILQGARKAFRNRGKTQADFAAEKEAADVNKTCAAFDLMLRDYLLQARQGMPEQEALDDLLGILGEMQSCEQAGKLRVPGKGPLTQICRAVADHTAALTGGPLAEVPEEDLFGFLREQLQRQKDMLR